MVPFPLIRTKLQIHLIHFSVTFFMRLKKKLFPATTSFSCYLTDPAKNSHDQRSTDEKEIGQKIKAMTDSKALAPNIT